MDETLILPIGLLILGFAVGIVLGAMINNHSAHTNYKTEVLQSCIADGKKLYVCHINMISDVAIQM
ncbi:MAG: hypothetical protein ABFD50_18630 [Smithella sp.]